MFWWRSFSSDLPLNLDYSHQKKTSLLSLPLPDRMAPPVFSPNVSRQSSLYERDFVCIPRFNFPPFGDHCSIWQKEAGQSRRGEIPLLDRPPLPPGFESPFEQLFLVASRPPSFGMQRISPLFSFSRRSISVEKNSSSVSPLSFSLRASSSPILFQ